MHLELLMFMFVTFGLGLGGLRQGVYGGLTSRSALGRVYGSSVVGLVAVVWLGLCPWGGLVNWGGLGLTLGGVSVPLSLVGGWQYSTLLACVLPSVVFGVLFVTKLAGHTVRGVLALVLLLGAGVLFTLTDVLLWWLLSFELLLLVSLYLLRLTSKSERIGEAVTEMFFWTLAGSICLLLGFVKQAGRGYGTLETLHEQGGLGVVVGVLFLVGFGVKLPLWPCFSWLLRAHVEASVEFSILLSGVVVKFGALGLYRTFLLQSTPLCSYIVVACGTLAIVEAALRLITQRDLKRIVALTTVIEMNWVGVCIGLGGAVFDEVGAFLLVAHSLTTTGEFFSVESLYRRYGSRDAAVVSGVSFTTPLLYACLFVTTLVTIGFPGSSLFAAKLLFLTALCQFSAGLCFFYTFWFVLVLPVFFLRVWVPVWFGQPRSGAPLVDLLGRDLVILGVSLLGGLLLGLYPALALA